MLFIDFRCCLMVFLASLLVEAGTMVSQCILRLSCDSHRDVRLILDVPHSNSSQPQKYSFNQLAL